MIGLFKFLIKPMMFLMLLGMSQFCLFTGVKFIWELFTPISKQQFVFVQLVCVIFMWIIAIRFIYRRWRGKNVKAKHDKGLNKIEKIKDNENTLIFNTSKGKLKLNNPFRGIFVVGSAGSGKSESIAVPLIRNFAEQGYTGIIYDFKFPSLGTEMETFLKAQKGDIKHYFLDFNNPKASYRVNPLNPKYIPNTSYAREYAQSIISNLMIETIKKPDYWSRSATDLLTACIWFLKAEHPHICDLPHVLAMITSQSFTRDVAKKPTNGTNDNRSI